MYKLIIKTNQYAGNFERELCAWCTGFIGDCGVGDEMVEKDIVPLFEDNIAQVPDDHGTMRPVSLYEKDCNALEIHFYEKPTIEQINLIKQRAELFNEEVLKRNSFYKEYPSSWKPVKIIGYMLVRYETVEFEETIDFLENEKGS